MALPRVLLAMLISIVLALPLEIRIFENRIEAQISENSQNNLNNRTKELKDILDSRVTKGESISDSIIAAERTKSIDPEEVVTLKKERDQCKVNNNVFTGKAQPIMDDLEKNRNDLLSEIKELNTTNTNLSNALINEYIIIADTSSIKQDIGRANAKITATQQIIKGNTAAIKAKIRNKEDYNKQILGKQSEINLRYNQCKQLDTTISKLLQTHVLQKDSLIKKLNWQLQKSKHSQDTAKLVYEDERLTIELVNKISFTSNFITQVEAFGILISNERKKGNFGLPIASLILSLLFFGVEVAPIFVKLISPQGTLDSVRNDKQRTEEEASKEIEANRKTKIVGTEKEIIEKEQDFVKERAFKKLEDSNELMLKNDQKLNEIKANAYEEFLTNLAKITEVQIKSMAQTNAASGMSVAENNRSFQELMGEERPNNPKVRSSLMNYTRKGMGIGYVIMLGLATNYIWESSKSVPNTSPAFVVTLCVLFLLGSIIGMFWFIKQATVQS